jgi:hypothetical protein
MLRRWRRPRHGADGAGSNSLQMRAVLFGEVSIEQWTSDDPGEPWQTFAAARLAMTAQDRPKAIELCRSITTAAGLESRQYLQAWHFLRKLGEKPPPELAKRVYGVVIEHWVDSFVHYGFDVVAAYADHSARYFNHAGGGVVWEHPDESLDAAIDAVIGAGEELAMILGPWDGRDAPEVPPPEHVRLNILTPSGLHFGTGPVNVMYAEPLAQNMLNRAGPLMVSLMDKSH